MGIEAAAEVLSLVLFLRVLKMAREDEDKDGKDPIYKVKVIPFLGRSVPIVLQNDNGPCPLIAISKFLF